MVGAGGGQIVAISSVAGIAGVPLRSAYSAAKHGVIGYHDAVRAENEHLGLKVLVVAPGSVATDVSRNALDAEGGMRGKSDKAIDNGLAPAFAAAQILDAVEAGRSEEHTSELQSLMRISYAVFCLKKTIHINTYIRFTRHTHTH